MYEEKVIVTGQVMRLIAFQLITDVVRSAVVEAVAKCIVHLDDMYSLAKVTLLAKLYRQMVYTEFFASYDCSSLMAC
jgi:hypothetical protein